MTKTELLNKQKQLTKELEDINKQLEAMPLALKLDNYDKPLSKYTIAEMNDLNTINEDAFNYMIENAESSILEYNSQSYMADKVPLFDFKL